MKIKKIVVLIFVLLTILFYALFQGGFVSWFLFYSFIPFGVYALLLSLYPIKSFYIKREINQTSFKAGEQLVGEIYLKRRIPIPLAYLIIEEIVPNHLQVCQLEKNAKVMLFPWFKREMTYQYIINSMPRGVHHFSKIRVKFGDLLGLIEKEFEYTCSEKFLVYPKIIPIDYRRFRSVDNQGMTTSNRYMHRDTTIAVGAREYKPGDRLTWIDWKSTARKNTMMTKEFEQQQSRDVVILMDRMKSNEFEHIVTFSASLTKAILKRGAKVGFISIGLDRAVFPITNRDVHEQNIYDHLATVQDDAPQPFSRIIDNEKKEFRGNSTYMFITSRLGPELVETIKKLSYQNSNIFLFIIKEEVINPSLPEKKAIELLRIRHVFVYVVAKEQFSDVFIGVNAHEKTI